MRRHSGSVMTRQQRHQLLTNKIYVYRKEKKWTLKKLAALSGVRFNTVWRIENGYSTALRNAYRIANVFQASIYDLWDIPPSGDPVASGKTRNASPLELRIQRGWVLDDLSRLSGVSKTTLFHVEQGHTPALEIAVKIARAFGVSVYDIWKP